MKDSSSNKIRNFTLAGHAGSGKTSLADLILYKSGAVTRLGRVDQESSVSDFRPEEHGRKSSIFTSLLNCTWKDHDFFFSDTPGYADFVGEAIGAIGVADLAVIVVDASSGIGPGTIRAWKEARDKNIPRLFFINGLDREQSDYEGVLKSLQESYGATVCIPVTVPVGHKAGLSSVVHVLLSQDVPAEISDDVSSYREALMDTVAESDEELMMKYLEGEELTEAEISQGLHQAIQDGSVVPVFAGSVEKDIGIEELLNGIINLGPDPLSGPAVPLKGEGEWDRTKDVATGFVFKSVTDPFIGQLTFFRVYSGVFRADGDTYNVTTGDRERFSGLLHVNGKEQSSVEQAGPGEIVAVAKLKNTHLNHTLSNKSDTPEFKPAEYPKPTMSQAVFAVKKGDEEKIGQGLTRLQGEDPTLKLDRNPETHEMVLSGMGDQHLSTVISRLQSEFKVEVELATPKVPYRETITSVGSAQYRHKKQTGGHGQFAEVHLRLEPLPDEDFEFGNEVVGGNIPKNFIPAVEKGVLETMSDGPLAGSKVINMKAIVFDGKHHPVDSSEMAFKIAARGAFREAMRNAKPILLEPIMSLKIVFPEEYMGDITGDLNTRRGRILGMDREEGMQVLKAEAPLAEVFTYATQLRSITQGRGSFEMEFTRYEAVPSNIAQQIQDEAAKQREEE